MEMARTPRHRARNETLNERPDGQSRHESRENFVLEALPTTLNGMLKITTETGKLDLFTVNTSHLPQLPASSKRFRSSCLIGLDYDDDAPPRSQQESRYPSGLLGIDDRRCLPSYARDTTSEIVSMYETASQKASNVCRYEDSDSRVYSMNQTFQPPITFSNHRSFESLRSQPEPSLPQQPRSPFPYRRRLKPPGFRPSSPAPTDDGGMEYVRRVEIDRITTGSVYNASSPSFLYAHKVFPALFSIRSDTNRFDSSPPRRSRPLERTQTNDSLQAWRNQPEFIPVNASSSPARSGYSFASTVNLLQAGPLQPRTTTSAKAILSPPLYYDYTEDFEDEAETQEYEFVERLPPSPFMSMVDRIIHEDRELSSEWSSPDTSVAPSPGFTSYTPIRAKLSGKEDFLVEAGHDVNDEESPPPDGVQDTLSLYSTRQVLPDKVASENLSSNTAQQINIHQDCIESMLIRLGGHSTTVRIVEQNEYRLNKEDELKHFQKITRVGRSDRDETGVMKSISNRSSTCSLSSHLPNLTESPSLILRFSSDPTTTARSQQVMILKPKGNQVESAQETGLQKSQMNIEGELKQRRSAQLILSSSDYPREFPHATVPCRAFTRVNSTRSTRFFSIDHGLQDLAQLTTRFEDANQRISKDIGMQLADILMRPLPALPSYVNTAIPRDLPTFLDDLKPWPRLNKFRSESDIRRTIDDLRKPAFMRPRTLQPIPAGVSDRRYHDEQNGITHSDSPTLSPDSMSPVKLSRVKNSVTRLMKTLPPLPPKLTYAATPVKQILEEIDNPLPTRHKKLRVEAAETLLGESEAEFPSVEFDSILTTNRTPPPLPNFKSKSSTSGVRASSSPEHSRLWNFDESYPWTGKQSLLLSSTLRKPELTNPHRLKLKNENPSDLSCSDTIRVNRRVKGCLSKGSMELLNPKDLFTTTSNSLNDVPQQCDFRVQRAKSSGPSEEQLHTKSVSVSLGPEALSHLCGLQPQNLRDMFYNPQRVISAAETNTETFSQPAAALISPLEVQSFFTDDSSQFWGHSSLRNRLSNFRLRMSVPYSSQTASQSDDDILWRDRNLEEHALQTLRTYQSKLHLNITVAGQDKAFLPEVSQRLKSKVSGWFKYVESAVLKYMHARKHGNLGVSSSRGG